MLVLAKQMYAKLVHMIDFTHGKGPLNNTQDFIDTASQLPEDGSEFGALGRKIVDQCPDGSLTKKDLLAYLEQIPLFCNQLRINYRVKGKDLDLIETAKNLMTTVVWTLKIAYIASINIKDSKMATLTWEMKVCT